MVCTKVKGVGLDTIRIRDNTGESVLTRYRFNNNNNNVYKLYYHGDSHYKRIYAETEDDAIVQAVKVVRKKLYLDALKRMNASKEVLVILQG